MLRAPQGGLILISEIPCESEGLGGLVPVKPGDSYRLFKFYMRSVTGKDTGCGSLLLPGAGGNIITD